LLARMFSQAVQGMEAGPVEVETDLGRGLPAFTIVGLPDTAVRESRERVRAGMTNSGYEFPLRRITVNLAPADTRKEGPAFDLPIALSLLAASGQMPRRRLPRYAAAGELSLDGSVRRINGALAMAEGARRSSQKGLLLPAANAAEASLVEGVEVIGVESLEQAASFLAGELELEPLKTDITALVAAGNGGCPDLMDVKGQARARRALEVCAAGGHNLLMAGPPGAGKTMLARRLPSILPRVTADEALEITRIYSVAGALAEGTSLMVERPFRAPHHSISHAGLVGGGRMPRPGEVSLSHLGVLFLDELPEFSRLSLEALRQPLEDGLVTVSRAITSVTYPARFMLVAAMNPCPCGHLGDRGNRCLCPPEKVNAYQGRVSGPLMDRIDVVVEVPPLSRKELLSSPSGEGSSEVAPRVLKARRRQSRRLKEEAGLYCNAQMSNRLTERHCRLEPGAASLLEGAIDRLALSARAYQRIMRVARTIADLDGGEDIAAAHLAEAISSRGADRGVGYGG